MDAAVCYCNIQPGVQRTLYEVFPCGQDRLHGVAGLKYQEPAILSHMICLLA